MPLTRADIIGRKMTDAVHVDCSRSEHAWLGNVEGVPRLSVARGRDKSGNFQRWYVDSKPVPSLDGALAVLNGEKTLEEVMAEAERAPRPHFSIDAQLSEVERELKMREQVYGRMSFPNSTFKRKSEAEMASDIMRSVLDSLKWNRENRADVIEWVKAGKPKATKPSNAA
jgi:hypothetical protein